MASYFPEPRPEIRSRLEAGDAALARAMKNQRRPRFERETLISTAEPHGCVYRLTTGWIARTRGLGDGREQIITVFLPGDLLGLKTMFYDRQPDALVCLSSVTLVSMEYPEAIRLACDNPDVGFRIMWQLAEDERRLHNWVIALGRADALERVATLLLELRGRLSGAGLVHEDNRYRMPMTQKQLGDHLGLTVVHVNRTLRTLRERGICTVRGGEVAIGDLTALAALAQPVLDIFERESEAFGASASASARREAFPGSGVIRG